MNRAVYVDGFNLYYRLLRKQANAKWLNVLALSQKLFPNDKITVVRYLTARIRALDDGQAPQRQETYLRALNTLAPVVSVHLGYFRIYQSWRRLQHPITGLAKSALISHTQEKGSDVNLASHFLLDAFGNRFEKAAVVTSDADFAEPIRIVEHELRLPVTLVHPTKHPAPALSRVGPSEILRLSLSSVRMCQFPKVLTDGAGEFRSPESW